MSEEELRRSAESWLRKTLVNKTIFDLLLTEDITLVLKFDGKEVRLQLDKARALPWAKPEDFPLSPKIKCPWCEEFIEASMYSQHYDTCPKRKERWEKMTPKVVAAVTPGKGPLIKPVWKERASEAIAREIVARGRFEKRDLDELTEKIQKMLDKYEKEWG